MNIICLKHIRKSFKNIIALDDVSFEVEANTIFGLLGVNGAGKTTLINILLGLLKKDEGEAYIDGYPLSARDKINKIVNVAFQENAFGPNLTVLENIEFFKKIYEQKDEEYLAYLIDAFKMKPYLHTLSKHLSLGYQKRLSLLLSLISKPKILMLDEPTLGLDILSRKELYALLEHFKHQMTIIISSHYLDEIGPLCDQIGILDQGKIHYLGSVLSLLEQENKTTLSDAFVSLITSGENQL
jgi:ABC-2 type transport system ATP-binding protein